MSRRWHVSPPDVIAEARDKVTELETEAAAAAAAAEPTGTNGGRKKRKRDERGSEGREEKGEDEGQPLDPSHLPSFYRAFQSLPLSTMTREQGVVALRKLFHQHGGKNHQRGGSRTNKRVCAPSPSLGSE